METIRSLLEQDYPSLDMIVVDNASSDGSRELIQQTYPELSVRCTVTNLGYCAGNNVALSLGLSTGYDAVVIANHDIEVGPDAITRLVRASLLESSVGVVGGQEVSFSTGDSRTVGGRGYNFWVSRRRWLSRAQLPDHDERPLRVDYVQGALVLFTRLALESGVRLNEEMFAYTDEIELGFQLRSLGLTAYADPGLIIRHKSLGGRFGAKEGYLMQRNRWYLVRHYGRWYHRLVCFFLMSCLELPIKCFYRAVLGYPRFARACLWGFVDGIRGIGGPGRLTSL